MARKPADPVKLSLRFNEALRLQIEKSAAKSNRSMNEEIVRRLEGSFTKDDMTAMLETLADRVVERIRAK